MARPTARRSQSAPPVTRAQLNGVRRDVQRLARRFEEMMPALREVEHACDIQFRRIAQLQAELDQVRRSLKP